MRLTLRTLLAYLDERLKEPEAKELGEKITESEFATGLVHRIRACIRRPRLGAPRLDGKGLGLDPNTVAEYLDNTLPQDRVPDLERVCLESDVHLAEVAACHQILALVVSEPATVEAPLRQRMYGALAAHDAGQRAATDDEMPETEAPPVAAAAEPPVQRPETVVPVAPPAAAFSAAAAAPSTNGQSKAAVATAPASPTSSEAADDASAPQPRHKPEIPDYLLATRRTNVWPIVATALLAFVAALVALRAMGRFDRTHPLVRLFSGSEDVAVVTPNGGPSGPGQPHSPPRPAVQPTPIDPVSPTPNDPSPNSAAPSPTTPTVPPVSPEVTRPSPTPTDNPAATPAPTVPARPADPVVARPATPEPAPAVPAPTAPPVEPAPNPNSPKPPVVPPVEPAPSENAKPAATFGRFSSDEQVLARFDAASGFWMRLKVDTPVVSGVRYFVPQGFRPQLVTAGANVKVIGPAALQVLPPNGEQDRPTLWLEFGRMHLVNIGEAGTQVSLALADRRGALIFGDTESTVAIEARRARYPGSNPEQQAALTIVRVQTANGRAAWREGPTVAAAIELGQALDFAERTAPVQKRVESVPEWLDPAAIPVITRQAAVELRAELVVDKSLVLSLQENALHRRTEVGALAVANLTQLDEFESAIDLLNNPNYRSYWDGAFDSLHDALTRGPASAAKLRATLERRRGNQAELLYRMLWSYGPEQWAQSVGSLIDNLEHRDMDVRVLAYQNLKRITGKTLNFRPDYDSGSKPMKPYIIEWRQRLKEGTLTYQAPSPLTAQ